MPNIRFGEHAQSDAGTILVPLRGYAITSSLSAAFQRNEPGKWFTHQSDEVLAVLIAAYQEEPTPSVEQMEELARRTGAPGVSQVRTFFDNVNQNARIAAKKNLK